MFRWLTNLFSSDKPREGLPDIPVTENPAPDEGDGEA